MENKLVYKCIQYTFEGKRITEYFTADGTNHWFEVKIPFVNLIKTFKTGVEVKNFLGGKPQMIGHFEVWWTPTGRAIIVNK